MIKSFVYRPFGQFVSRLPSLPFSNLESILSEVEDNGQLPLDPSIEESIYLASPILFDDLYRLKQGLIGDESKRNRIISSYIKYISRMSTRCTPFGLFASCSMGKVGSTSCFHTENETKRLTRLDMSYLCALSNELSKLPAIRESSVYYPNNTLYRVSNKVRYIDFKYTSDRIIHNISSVDFSKILADIIKKSKKGATIAQLVEFLDSKELDSVEAEVFIGELIDSHLLLSELHVSPIGDGYLETLFNALSRFDLNESSKDVLTKLQSIDRKLKEIDSDIGVTVDEYKKIVQIANEIAIPFKENNLFQVDLFQKKSQMVLGEHIIDEIKSVIKFFARTSFYKENVLLQNFKAAFYARFEEEEVPLSLALDPEIGIGYPVTNGTADMSTIVESVIFPKTQSVDEQLNEQSLIFSKYLSRNKQEREILIHYDDIKSFEEDYSHFSSTIYVIFQVVRDDNDGFLLNIKAVGGGSAAKLLARFSHLDNDALDLVKEISRKEDDLTEGVIAEIVHLPNSRVGNILSRPHIRDYEIVYLSDSKLPENKKLPISDLFISYRDSKLILRSKSLNKQIYPVLTTAHNYHNDTLPAYRFLCDLQHQNTSGGTEFTWGPLENRTDYRPRVKYGNSILSLASWTIYGDDFKGYSNLTNEELFNKIENWRKKRSVPRRVLLADGDNELFVDFEYCVSTRALLSVVKNRPKFVLKEFVFENSCLAVKGSDGGYLNEFVVGFHKKNK